MRSESRKEAGRRRQSTAPICMLLAVMGMMSEEDGSEAGWVLERRSLCAGVHWRKCGEEEQRGTMKRRARAARKRTKKSRRRWDDLNGWERAWWKMWYVVCAGVHYNYAGIAGKIRRRSGKERRWAKTVLGSAVILCLVARVGAIGGAAGQADPALMVLKRREEGLLMAAAVVVAAGERIRRGIEKSVEDHGINHNGLRHWYVHSGRWLVLAAQLQEVVYTCKESRGKCRW